VPDIVHYATLYAPPEGLTIREILLRVRPPHLDFALAGRTRLPGAISLDTLVLPGQSYNHRFYEDPHGIGQPAPGVEVHVWRIALVNRNDVDDTPDEIDPTFTWAPSKVDS
jgi:hypothetical protein